VGVVAKIGRWGGRVGRVLFRICRCITGVTGRQKYTNRVG